MLLPSSFCPLLELNHAGAARPVCCSLGAKNCAAHAAQQPSPQASPGRGRLCHSSPSVRLNPQPSHVNPLAYSASVPRSWPAEVFCRLRPLMTIVSWAGLAAPTYPPLPFIRGLLSRSGIPQTLAPPNRTFPPVRR